VAGGRWQGEGRLEVAGKDRLARMRVIFQLRLGPLVTVLTHPRSVSNTPGDMLPNAGISDWPPVRAAIKGWLAPLNTFTVTFRFPPALTPIRRFSADRTAGVDVSSSPNTPRTGHRIDFKAGRGCGQTTNDSGLVVRIDKRTLNSFRIEVNSEDVTGCDLIVADTGRKWRFGLRSCWLRFRN
jgi:hypothetical protein